MFYGVLIDKKTINTESYDQVIFVVKYKLGKDNKYRKLRLSNYCSEI